MQRVFAYVVISILTILGWLSFILDIVKSNSAYEENISKAEEWSAMGLYQRAVDAYGTAIEYKESAQDWNQMILACEKRYAEDEDYYSEYLEMLEDAVTAYPENIDFYKQLVTLYEADGKYTTAYLYLKKAVDEKIADEELIQMYKECKYLTHLQDAEYDAFSSEMGGYAVKSNGKWDNLTTSGYYEDRTGYVYLNQRSEDGIQLYVTETDGRLINKDGLVMGIFPFLCTEAGVFSEDYIAVKMQDTYDYYDAFARKIFGGYDVAGSFYNGTAAVEQKDGWHVIDTEGVSSDDTYADIVLDNCGFYNRYGVVLAAAEPGKYQIYNDKWEKANEFSCDDIDFCTSDHLMAYRNGNYWGYVDDEGNVVIEPQYEAAKSFSNGLAAVCIDGKWGFINRENELVIPCDYLDADYFNADGSCMVCTWKESDLAEENEEITYAWRLLVLEIGIQ
ncbi:MAG: WG repeat-containing protein [Roseburia sp.]